jgi:hypothetical protein
MAIAAGFDQSWVFASFGMGWSLSLFASSLCSYSVQLCYSGNRPGVKVLVTTGDAARAEMSPDTVGPVLAKPYTGRDLLDRVQRALTKPVADDSGGTK